MTCLADDDARTELPDDFGYNNLDNKTTVKTLHANEHATRVK